MAKVENDLDIYYAVGNANTQRQEKELAAIMKKRNSAGWKLISTSTAILDTKNQSSILYLFWEKRISNQCCENLIPFAIRLYVSKNPHTLTSDK